MTAPTLSEPQSSPPPQKSSFLKWLIIGGLGCLFILLLAIGGCVGLGYFGYKKAAEAVQTSVAYLQSLGMVEKDARIKKALGGEPEPAGTSAFNFSTVNGQDSADLQYSVKGPSGSATVHVKGTGSNGTWTLHSVLVTLPDGKQIDLANGIEEGDGKTEKEDKEADPPEKTEKADPPAK